MKPDSVHPDPRNARVHGESSQAAIRRSVERLGAGRSIVTDAEGGVVAGNGVLAEAQALGLKLRLIETDGSELVAVRRTDLATGDPARRALAIADNAVAALADWDTPTLDALKAEIGASLEEVAGFGLDATGSDFAPPPPDDPSTCSACEPYGTTLRLGAYHCDVDRADYERVLEAIRLEVGFGEDEIVAELLRRLGA